MSPMLIATKRQASNLQRLHDLTKTTPEIAANDANSYSCTREDTHQTDGDNSTLTPCRLPQRLPLSSCTIARGKARVFVLFDCEIAPHSTKGTLESIQVVHSPFPLSEWSKIFRKRCFSVMVKEFEFEFKMGLESRVFISFPPKKLKP